MYQNHLNSKSIAYETPPIKVNLTGESKSNDPAGNSNSATLIIIIVLFSYVILTGIGFFLFKR